MGKVALSISKIGQNFDRKKNVRLYFGLNQIFLLYKLCRMIVKTTCIEAFFDLGQNKDVHFFYGRKKLRLQPPISVRKI